VMRMTFDFAVLAWTRVHHEIESKSVF